MFFLLRTTFFYVCMAIRGVYSKMAEVSIYKFIVHKKWTTLSPQKVDDFKFTKVDDFKFTKGGRF